ncbi:MAG: hypothetical protein ACHQT6_00175 [Candidatus Acidiferrales bacterium]
MKRDRQGNSYFFCAAALLLLAIVAAAGGGISASPKNAATSDPSNWKGHTWKLTNGGMAGVAKGNPANLFVDEHGYLHLRIINRGGTYTASEMFSADKMGFGTYQWQIEGALLNMDKSTVLGLFSYGPTAKIGADAENEIDIEFSQWNNTCHGCNADFTFWPATGNKSLGPKEDNFKIDLGGATLTTARYEWSSTKIVGTIMSGLQPLGTTANVLQTLTFAPPDYTARIPQVPLPLGMNLWCFKVPPASGQEVVIRDFQFVPADAAPTH